jgi:hypothetical protein
MQSVVNRKERANSRWRFAGLYILSVAIPALVIINGIDMGKVDCEENEQLVEQLRKRDQALAQVSHLAALLNRAQELKPAYAAEPTDQAKYDQLHYDFERGVDRLKQLYYSDTALYKHNYHLVAFMESNHKEYDRIGDEFRNRVDDAVMKKQVAAPKGGGNEAELMVLQIKLQNAQNQVSELKERLASTGKSDSGQLEDMRNKAIMIDANIDQIGVVLAEIEQDCNGIQKKSDKNMDIKNKILDKVKFLKDHAAGIKNTNKNLIGMID